MADYHLTNTMQAFTNIPRDRYVNTFNLTWIAGAPIPEQDSPEVLAACQALEDFYVATSVLFSPVIIQAATVRAYQWGDPEPRVPFVYPYFMDPRGTAGTFEEVAFVLGFRGAPPHTRQRRGRIYLGPLSTNALDAAGATDFSSISGSMAPAFVAAAQDLGNAWFAAGWLWVISNRTGSSEVPIAEFTWDLSPDTQRRRGWTPSTRSVASAEWATP